MQLVRLDTQRAYELIREKITTLELAPGAPIDEQALADELGLELVPIREALKLLAHDGLVEIPPDGLYVAGVDLPDLEAISEIRVLLESFCARKAADRASEDDLAVLEALAAEQAALGEADTRDLFALDHRFHQAIARAAHNRYLAVVLERFFGLSQRLWYLVLPELEFLPDAVEKHQSLVAAIRDGDAGRAEALMHEHVSEFYASVHDVLAGTQD
jgi:DNA-binding GntR family transcriptional regulator